MLFRLVVLYTELLIRTAIVADWLFTTDLPIPKITLLQNRFAREINWKMEDASRKIEIRVNIENGAFW